MYFGKEIVTGMSVVVKKLNEDDQEDLLRELQITLRLEILRNDSQEQSVIQQMISKLDYRDGLPQILGIKLAQTKGEIMMANAGNTLSRWSHDIGSDLETRFEFAFEMCKQLINALKRLHTVGYSHCDLKYENICASVNKAGKLIFTLIDFGVSSKLKLGSKCRNIKVFRGNFNYSTFEHIANGRANQVDDVTSLLYIAFKFVYRKLPWEDFKDNKSSPNEVAYAVMRYTNRHQFRQDLINSETPFAEAFTYLQAQNIKVKKLRHQQSQSTSFNLDYAAIQNLIPPTSDRNWNQYWSTELVTFDDCVTEYRNIGGSLLHQQNPVDTRDELLDFYHHVA